MKPNQQTQHGNFCVTLATFPDNTGTSDSRQCLKETSPGSISFDVSVTGNHLDIPRTNDPNLLSPETIQNQRRNSRRPSILPVPDMYTGSTLNLPQVKLASGYTF
ncbi:unnamed protein product [Acanthoscelides obtectus]|uniref:Uncharacterized protein n=1 Tax=Acanthoscelides obtectus TaxID=200917 RepID=A0A9P0K673_ACAOB|nr:unnamed protein product [Acanthoscelides obtectus]CAK1640406.1 hypothetical protein AOBTE_LOCUS11708 [Acanthoscelides obtectus]